MSFADVSRRLNDGDVASRQKGTFRSPNEHMVGNVAALEKNNDLLRKWIGMLQAALADKGKGSLAQWDMEKRMRDLREVRRQNRDLARASKELWLTMDRNDARGSQADPHLTAVKARLVAALESFSQILKESVEVEWKLMGNSAGVASVEAVPMADWDEDEQRLPESWREAVPLLDQNSDTMPSQRRLFSEHSEAVDREILSNEQLLMEREAALEVVESSLRDVQLIFQDLAVMIGDQGTQLEEIEMNVADARERTRRAVDEVQKCKLRNERCGNTFWWLLVFCSVVLSLYGLVLFS